MPTIIDKIEHHEARKKRWERIKQHVGRILMVNGAVFAGTTAALLAEAHENVEPGAVASAT